MTTKRLQEIRTAHNLDRKRKRSRPSKLEVLRRLRQSNLEAHRKKGYGAPEQADDQHQTV